MFLPMLGSSPFFWKIAGSGFQKDFMRLAPVPIFFGKKEKFQQTHSFKKLQIFFC
jgi:hypothetical protein